MFSVTRKTDQNCHQKPGKPGRICPNCPVLVTVLTARRPRGGGGRACAGCVRGSGLWRGEVWAWRGVVVARAQVSWVRCSQYCYSAPCGEMAQIGVGTRIYGLPGRIFAVCPGTGGVRGVRGGVRSAYVGECAARAELRRLRWHTSRGFTIKGMDARNLLGIPETRLAAEPEVTSALEQTPNELAALEQLAAEHPESSAVWASAADAAFAANRHVTAYAYARVGYHRGLDALRKAGWRGQGPVPWEHEPNRGVLRSVWQLRRAADAIGETAEVERLTAFLRDADPVALDAAGQD